MKRCSAEFLTGSPIFLPTGNLRSLGCNPPALVKHFRQRGKFTRRRITRTNRADFDPFPLLDQLKNEPPAGENGIIQVRGKKYPIHIRLIVPLRAGHDTIELEVCCGLA